MFVFTQCIAIHVTSFHITKQKKKKKISWSIYIHKYNSASI